MSEATISLRILKWVSDAAFDPPMISVVSVWERSAFEISELQWEIISEYSLTDELLFASSKLTEMSQNVSILPPFIL